MKTTNTAERLAYCEEHPETLRDASADRHTLEPAAAGVVLHEKVAEMQEQHPGRNYEECVVRVLKEDKVLREAYNTLYGIPTGSPILPDRDGLGRRYEPDPNPVGRAVDAKAREIMRRPENSKMSYADAVDAALHEDPAPRSAYLNIATGWQTENLG